MLVYGKYECFVMQMLDVCVLCASCVSYQCCILHDSQFVNVALGCKRRQMEDVYSRAGLMTALCHECLLLFTPSC